MARRPGERFPSDATRRKTKPAVRIHHSIAHHPRMAEIYADNDLLATWLRIMVEASRSHAGKTGDSVTLPANALCTLGARRTRVRGASLVRRVCAVLAWRVRETNAGVTIWVRNFAKKQGFDPTPHTGGDGVSPRTPDSSESESESESEEKDDVRGAPQKSGAGLSALDALRERWDEHRAGKIQPAPITLSPAKLADLRDAVEAHRELGWWDAVFRRVASSPFLRGERTEFVATFLWATKGDRPDRILRGEYDERKAQTGPRKLRLADGRVKTIPPGVTIEWTDAADALAYYETPSGKVVVRKGAEWLSA